MQGAHLDTAFPGNEQFTSLPKEPPPGFLEEDWKRIEKRDSENSEPYYW
jgi:hypothetical protein